MFCKSGVYNVGGKNHSKHHGSISNVLGKIEQRKHFHQTWNKTVIWETI